MPGVEGAIFRVELNGGVRYQVLGGGEPQGLCGTGLVDAVAVLLSIGLIDPCGRLLYLHHSERYPRTAARQGGHSGWSGGPALSYGRDP